MQNTLGGGGGRGIELNKLILIFNFFYDLAYIFNPVSGLKKRRLNKHVFW